MSSDQPDPPRVTARVAEVAARVVTPLSSTEIVRNFVYAISYVVLPDRYVPYRIARSLLSSLGIGARNWRPPPGLGDKVLAIEACAHSGSSFLVDNIHPDVRDRVVSHFHRQWSLSRCLRHGVPTVLLVRNPLEACLSKHWRSVARQDYAMTISMITALVVWIAYYRHAWRDRDRLCVIMFPELARDFASVRRRVEAWSGVRLVDTPSHADRNEFLGERPQLRLCFLSRVLLKAARTRYRKFDLVARAQRGAGLASRPPEGTAPLGRTSRRPAAWARWGISLLCGVAAAVLLIDWLCSRKIGFRDFGLIDIVGALIGGVVLVRAVRRLDYIERVVTIASDRETREAEWDSVVCCVAAMLCILGGVGGGVIGAALLLPWVRRAASTRLARASPRRRPLIVGDAGRWRRGSGGWCFA